MIFTKKTKLQKFASNIDVSKIDWLDVLNAMRKYQNYGIEDKEE